MAKLGVGIIGCGNISTAYLKLAPMFKALEVRRVADVNMGAATARAAEFNVKANSVDDLLAADDIDVVVNLTIPDAHYMVSKAILEAGKHAYSEKPLVLTLQEGETLKALATSKNLRVGSAPDTFLGGSHQMARRLIDEGSVGKIVAGTCHVMSHGMEHWHPNPDFFFLPGAGPVLDVGTILTEGPRKGEDIPVKTPTNIHALLDFVSGATITLSASWDVWAHRHPNMDLYGTEGSLFVPDPNFFGGDLKIAGRDGVVKDAPTWDHPFGIPNQEHKQGAMANYRTAGLADMAQGIVESRAHRCSLELAVHSVDVMTGILRSGETGGFVEMTTTCERPAALGPDEARRLMV
jgi:predicted dehydrogenase